MANIEVFKNGWLGRKDILRISSPYGNRQHPITKKISFHYGVDIAVPSGTPIFAPLNGYWGNYKVQTNNQNKVSGAGLYGWMIYDNVEGEKFQIVFMHLNRKADGLKSGDKLIAGETIIGYTGGTKGDPNAGSSTGAHLHIEIHANVGSGYIYTSSSGHAINPISYLNGTLQGANNSAVNIQSTTAVIPQIEIDNSATEWDNDEEDKYTYDEKYVNGIWQIVKVLIDKGVEKKQVYDSSISTMTGPLINFFSKVCQKPMVEFFGDTVGSQYYFFVRKPPFDSIGFRESEIADVISTDEVIRFSMSKNNNNIYSWYQYIPQAELLVSPQLQQYIPAVFFKEYAELWGSKPLVIQSNYYNYDYSGKDNKDGGSANNIIKNALLDFKYIIECNAYNPFAFTANVTLFGIKRIKRGTFVVFNNKKFYVEAVNHRIDFNGTKITDLQLSHGLEVDFIDEKNMPNGDKISYFNLIDFGNFENDIKDVKFSDWRDLLSTWKVDLDNFGWFLRVMEKTGFYMY